MAEFTEIKNTTEWLISTDTGYKPFSAIGKTIPYEIYHITTTTHELRCADHHLVYVLNEEELTLTETPAEALVVGDYIVIDDSTTEGVAELVVDCRATGEYAYMYDLIDVQDDRYYTNNILSHNSTTTVAYILHQILFNDYYSVAILANKSSIAMELLSRLKLSYEKLPIYLQQGIVNWNKYTIELENKSKVLAASTSTSSVRGNSFSLVYLDEFAHVENYLALEFFNSVYPTISSGKTTKMIITSCVVDGTFVMTPTGLKTNTNFIKGNSKTPRNYEIPEYQVLGHNGFNISNVFVNNGLAKTNTIVTKHTELECTENHKFWACRKGVYGWFESKDLSTDDYVALKYATHTYGNKDKCTPCFGGTTVTEDIAYIIGVYIAIGNKVKNTITFKAYKFYDKVLSDLGIDFTFADNTYTLKSKDLLHVIKYYDIKHHDIPEVFLQWSKDNIYALIQGIFDASAVDKYVPDKQVGNISLNMKSDNKKYIMTVHLLLMNAGIVNTFKSVACGTYGTELIYKLRIQTTVSIQYFEEIGFRLPYKQDWSKRFKRSQNERVRDDYVPYAFTLFKEKLDPIQLHAAMTMKNIWFQTRIKHYSRRRLLWRIETRLKRFQNAWMNEFIDCNLDPTIRWSRVLSNTSNVELKPVYDVALPPVTGDPWCQSVVYNGIVTHNTPKGMNLFYKMFTDAQRGINGYAALAVHWDQIPGRDEEFKRKTIAATSERQWMQEFNSTFPDTIVSIIDDDGVESTIKLGDLYDQLSSKQLHITGDNDIIDVQVIE